jgi:hypothetical protein
MVGAKITLRKCATCGSNILADAKSCSNCGAPKPATTNTLHQWIGGIMALGFLGVFFSWLNGVPGIVAFIMVVLIVAGGAYLSKITA